jgi:hypothetical protein
MRAATDGQESAGKGKGRVSKTVLRLPDLDQAKSVVLNSLSWIDAQRAYRHAIEEFIEWYCPEPRLSFSKTVALRHRISLGISRPAPSISASARYVVSPTRRPNVGCEARTWPLAYGASRQSSRSARRARRPEGQRRPAAGGELEKNQFLLGPVSIQTNDTFGRSCPVLRPACGLYNHIGRLPQ